MCIYSKKCWQVRKYFSSVLSAFVLTPEILEFYAKYLRKSCYFTIHFSKISRRIAKKLLIFVHIIVQKFSHVQVPICFCTSTSRIANKADSTLRRKNGRLTANTFSAGTDKRLAKRFSSPAVGVILSASRGVQAVNVICLNE